jgi:hypothetical protein
MNLKKLSVLVASLLLIPGSSNAYAHNGGWSCTHGNPFGWTPSWNYNVNNRLPPYFAVHPPVYYSGVIVRIPYGNSPFMGGAANNYVAPPAAVITIPGSNMAGMEIANPHYAAGAARSAPLPAPVQGAGMSNPGIMIANPFYRRDEKVAAK